jgi:[acyl-carrier-protein] S-malonyltransferase
MLATGVDTIVECGPGKVLTALNRRVERRPDLTMLSVEDPDGLAAALATCREKSNA